MYTDAAFLVKDRFREQKFEGSIQTLYRYPPAHPTQSLADPELLPDITDSVSRIFHCPPGLEILGNLTKLYLIKRIDLVEDDHLATYKAEIINEEGNRIFLITTGTTQHNSDEPIEYGNFTKMKMKGKICFGVVNYAGIKVFEIYGDPQKIIRIGPSPAVWGEIQVLPNPLLDRFPFYYCCCCCAQKKAQLLADETEIRVLVLKKDLGEKNGPCYQQTSIFKHVYTLRGKISNRCCKGQDNVLYKRSFNLQIYSHDALENEATVSTKKTNELKNPSKSRSKHDLLHDKKIKWKPIGRFCSVDYHEKLGCDLPILEIPKSMDIYDKLTLLGTFFFFSLV